MTKLVCCTQYSGAIQTASGSTALIGRCALVAAWWSGAAVLMALAWVAALAVVEVAAHGQEAAIEIQVTQPTLRLEVLSAYPKIGARSYRSDCVDPWDGEIVRRLCTVRDGWSLECPAVQENPPQQEGDPRWNRFIACYGGAQQGGYWVQGPATPCLYGEEQRLSFWQTPGRACCPPIQAGAQNGHPELGCYPVPVPSFGHESAGVFPEACEGSLRLLAGGTVTEGIAAWPGMVTLAGGSIDDLLPGDLVECRISKKDLTALMLARHPPVRVSAPGSGVEPPPPPPSGGLNPLFCPGSIALGKPLQCFVSASACGSVRWAAQDAAGSSVQGAAGTSFGTCSGKWESLPTAGTWTVLASVGTGADRTLLNRDVRVISENTPPPVVEPEPPTDPPVVDPVPPPDPGCEPCETCPDPILCPPCPECPPRLLTYQDHSNVLWAVINGLLDRGPVPGADPSGQIRDPSLQWLYQTAFRLRATVLPQVLPGGDVIPADPSPPPFSPPPNPPPAPVSVQLPGPCHDRAAVAIRDAVERGKAVNWQRADLSAGKCLSRIDKWRQGSANWPPMLWISLHLAAQDDGAALLPWLRGVGNWRLHRPEFASPEYMGAVVGGVIALYHLSPSEEIKAAARHWLRAWWTVQALAAVPVPERLDIELGDLQQVRPWQDRDFGLSAGVVACLPSERSCRNPKLGGKLCPHHDSRFDNAALNLALGINHRTVIRWTLPRLEDMTLADVLPWAVRHFGGSLASPLVADTFGLTEEERAQMVAYLQNPGDLQQAGVLTAYLVAFEGDGLWIHRLKNGGVSSGLGGWNRNANKPAAAGVACESGTMTIRVPCAWKGVGAAKARCTPGGPGVVCECRGGAETTIRVTAPAVLSLTWGDGVEVRR